MADSPGRGIVVDSKEATQHPLLLEPAITGPGSLAYAGFGDVTTSPMEYADVVITLSGGKGWTPFSPKPQPRLYIELKTWEDLHSSVQDKQITGTRMRRQLEGLLGLQMRGYEVAIMIVGVVTEQGTKGGRSNGVWVSGAGRRMKRNWSFYELEQIRLAIQRLGIPVYQVASRAAVPHGLLLMADLFEREELFNDPGLPAAAKLAPKLSFLTNQLTGVQGVGPKLAGRIAREHKNFASFFEDATVETLEEIDKIGKVKAQQIYAAFHGIEVDKPQGWELE